MHELIVFQFAVKELCIPLQLLRAKRKQRRVKSRVLLLKAFDFFALMAVDNDKSFEELGRSLVNLNCFVFIVVIRMM